MGADNDVLITQIVTSGGAEGADTTSTITGNVDLGDGDDLIYGGTGNAVIEGGDGVDTFYFRGTTGPDVITYFSAGDEILLLLPIYETFEFKDDILTPL